MTDEFDEVLTQLEALRFTPERSEAVARSGLQDFLGEAARLRPTVSARSWQRLTGWMSKFTQERSPMFALAIKIVLVLAVMFGGVGVTAAAAQSSLPNDVLYPVKLMFEDAQSSLAAGPEAQLDAQLDHAQQRVREMVQLTDRGVAIPADVPIRLQTQLQAALQIAAQLDDQSMSAALDRIQLRTQDHLRQMEQLQLNDAVQALTQAREMAQLGQRDPLAFRGRFGHGLPAKVPSPPALTPQSSRTPPGPRASLTPQSSRTPQATCTPQPHVTNTPQNHSYGPGPQGTQQPAATPVGQGGGHEYGPGPQSTPQGSGGSQETPTSGGSGNGFSGSGTDSGGNGTGSGSGSGRP